MAEEPYPTKPLKELDAREFRFVEEYVCGGPREQGNAYRSAMRAGYTHETAVAASAGWTRNPANQEKPGTKPHVYAAIMSRRAEIEHMLKIDKDWVIREMGKLARSSSAAFTYHTSAGDPYIDISQMTHDEMAALAEVQVEDYKEGRGEDARDVKRVKVKNYDKRAALESLGKMLGIATKVMHSNDPENPMPGAMAYDLSKLTEAEAVQLHALLAKAAPSSTAPSITATRPEAEDF